MKISIVLTKDDGTEMASLVYSNLEYKDVVDIEEAISKGLIALGRARIDAMSSAAAAKK